MPDAPPDPPAKRRSSAVARRRGRKGGRPLKHPRTVAPASEALPPHRGHEVFPVPAAVWSEFCDAYGDLMGKLAPAAEAAGLAPETVRGYFAQARKGREPYRTEVGKAVTMLGQRLRHGGRGLLKRDPMEFLTRAKPEEWPRAPRRIEATGKNGEPLSIVAVIEQARKGEPDDWGE